MLPCRFFPSQKGCHKGADCRFAHIPAAVGVPAVAIIPRPQNRDICKFFNLGICKNGQECAFSHKNGIPRASPAEQEEHDGDGAEMSVEVVGTTKVNFGPGARVISVNTYAVGTSRRVILSGLTGTVVDTLLVDQLSAFGTIGHFIRPAEIYAFVTFSSRAEAENCVLELNGRPLLDLKSIHVKLRPKPGVVGAMHASTVKVSWFDPSRTCYVHFTSLSAAQLVALSCNGKRLRESTAPMLQPSSRGARVFSVVLN